MIGGSKNAGKPVFFGFFTNRIEYCQLATRNLGRDTTDWMILSLPVPSNDGADRIAALAKECLAQNGTDDSPRVPIEIGCRLASPPCR